MAKYDTAHKATDKYLSNLEKKIASVYQQAADEMQDTVDSYFESFEQKCEQQQAKVDAGEMTKSEYYQWENTQLARGAKYSSLQNSLAERYTDANEVALSYVYDNTPSIYSLNRNYAAYAIEQSTSDQKGTFNLWDEATVRRLIVKDPTLMPNYSEQKALARGIDLQYGKEQISASILSGILQGKTLKQISRDLMNRLSNMNLASALRSARTAFTAAENGGRQDTYDEASKLGIDVKKQWLATLDSRTREAHRQADGQIVDNDEDFIVGGEKLKYPADPTNASGWNLYNCRCTTIAVLPDVDTSDAERWSRDPNTGEPELVSDMSYDDWAKEKQIEGKTAGNDSSVKEAIKETAQEHIPQSAKAGTQINAEGYLQFATGKDAGDYFHENGSGEWWDSLSIDEQNAIVDYTGNLYYKVNKALRDGEVDSADDEVKECIKYASSALSKYELKDDIVVYRGCTSKKLDAKQAGDSYTDEAFDSSSTCIDSAFGGTTLMEIHIPAGKGSGAWISDNSLYESEYEYLLQRGSEYYINSTDENGYVLNTPTDYRVYKRKVVCTLTKNGYTGG